jgi:predicted transcriptional regulator
MSDLSLLLKQLQSVQAFSFANRGSKIAHERAQALRHAIYNAVEQNPGTGATFIAELLDVSRETVSSHLQALRRAELIERNAGRYTGWTTCKK